MQAVDNYSGKYKKSFQSPETAPFLCLHSQRPCKLVRHQTSATASVSPRAEAAWFRNDKPYRHILQKLYIDQISIRIQINRWGKTDFDYYYLFILSNMAQNQVTTDPCRHALRKEQVLRQDGWMNAPAPPLGTRSWPFSSPTSEGHSRLKLRTQPVSVKQQCFFTQTLAEHLMECRL